MCQSTIYIKVNFTVVVIAMSVKHCILINLYIFFEPALSCLHVQQ